LFGYGNANITAIETRFVRFVFILIKYIRTIQLMLDFNIFIKSSFALGV